MKKWGKWGVYISATILMVLSVGYLIFSYNNENNANGEEPADLVGGGGAVNEDPQADDEGNTGDDNAEGPGELVDEAQAITITHDLLSGLRETFGRLGEEYKWSSVQDDWEQPGYTEPDFEIAKPHLLNYATEEFTVGTLRGILMEYYCFCDKLFIPDLHLDVRAEVLEVHKNLFVIKGISIANELGNGGLTGYLTVKNEDGKWKIDHWQWNNFSDEPINLTADEYLSYRDLYYEADDKLTFVKTIKMTGVIGFDGEPMYENAIEGEIDVHVFYNETYDYYFGIAANSSYSLSITESDLEKYQ
ncbi:hypothetical protein SAMN05877753_101613 [Bacillus oleivorans]|uniref:Uncharacterized protein n=1 Tax=Bacillus oleivorans TaxID=1448271 RepID=A0A285CI73_9BACI|nr:hypothetical protein [Bacillus oleivorans]SNX67294.1 hypothetical protein SAMN05877753_101613 [Bacillus oleivorans]